VEVRDANGNPLELEEHPIGRGGQGSVYRVRGSAYAVKLIEGSGLRSHAGDDLGARLRRLAWLPLEGIPLTMPRRSLQAPQVGYLMDLLENMEPIERLCIPTSDDIPEWYREGGGLRRRLRLLAACAAALAKLHARGLVYGDLSPSNVFVSGDAQQDRLCLIDADNISVEHSARGRRVGTPMYAAPEICLGSSGNTTFSDAHSLAVLAYEVLCTDHPFRGDLIEDEDDEDLVQRGELPWAGHSTDTRNRSQYSLGDRVLTERLNALFRQNFETGLFDPSARPDAARWTSELDKAADLTVDCPDAGCGNAYPVLRSRCPWCGRRRPPVLEALVWDHIPTQGTGEHGPIKPVPTGQVIILQDETVAEAMGRHVRPLGGDRAVRTLRMRWDGDGKVEIENTGSRALRLSGAVPRTLYPGAVDTVPIDSRIHFGSDREFHRLISFR
jgi:DNA-binding helix-hairpin-helix protein with protein kinase domain